MFKVSFKSNPKDPTKLFIKENGKTVAFLVGTVKLPEFWFGIPVSIVKWISVLESVEVYEDSKNNTLTIYTKGVSVCAEGDKYDTVFGERLAEARAKEHLYRFMYNLSSRLFNYYSKILYGLGEGGPIGSKSGLEAVFKKYEALHYHELMHINDLLAKNIKGENGQSEQ